jgi:CDP-2,3-bis-(O-geranylgeranyl)-sn-glycerol synthase
MTPPIAKRLGIFNFLAKPIDFDKKFLGEPILGSHKTWRGAILAFFVGFFTSIFQKFLFNFDFFKKISILNYSQINIFLFGFLISFGAVFGDLLFAFIKRRLKLEPGARFLFFDQTNYVIGAFLFLNHFFKIEISVWLTILISTFFLHIIVNRLGYYLKIHQAKW